MLPLPALDGGRLFFILIEAIRGRRVNPEREGMFHFVGIVVLITLMVLISINDLVAPLPGRFDWGGPGGGLDLPFRQAPAGPETRSTSRCRAHFPVYNWAELNQSRKWACPTYFVVWTILTLARSLSDCHSGAAESP